MKTNPIDPHFTVTLISRSLEPQSMVYWAMHQCYSEDFVSEQHKWFTEEEAGQVVVKRLLKGDRGHYGPLEHPQITFNCGWFPHSVMQQIRTHRVGMCLAGDTNIYTKTSGGGIKKIPIRDLYTRWTLGRSHQQSELDATYSQKRISSMSIYNLNENNLEFGSTHIRQIYCNGVKDLFLVKTVEGHSIKASQDHLFFTDKGWRKLGELAPGSFLTTRRYSGRSKSPFVLPLSSEDINSEQWRPIPEVCGYEVSNLGRVRSFFSRNGKSLTTVPRLKSLSRSKYLFYSANSQRRNVHVDVLTAFKGSKPSQEYVARHLDGNPYNNKAENLAWGTEKENRKDQGITTGFNCSKAHFVEIASIEYAGKEETYDLEVVGPYHNFLANDLVVHNSFDVQSFRYTGRRIVDLADGDLDVEEVFYARPVGVYRNRHGKRYEYTQEMRQDDLQFCIAAAHRYKKNLEKGMSEEHARSFVPFDVRQHWVMSCNLRSLMHLLDLRAKADAQLECQQLCQLIWPHFESWVPEIAAWYKENRWGKARLAP